MRSWKIDLRALLPRFAHDRVGAVAVMTGLALTSLLGFAGLGTDATLWYVAKRNMQGAVDVAAYSAATAEVAGANSTAFTAAAKAVTARYGFTDGAGGVTVTVNNPPLSGSYTSSSDAIEVIISQPQTLLFSALFLKTPPTATSRAVATETSGNPGPCVMALDKGDVTDVGDSGSGALNLNGCSLAVNSTSSSALQLSGSASITALSASIVGNYTKTGTATFTTTNGITTGATAATDPYSTLSVPSFSGCSSTSVSVPSGTKNLTASTYGGTMVICGSLSVSGSGALNLGPGTYIIDGGSFTVSGTTSSVTGSGVTIILTGAGSTYGTANISGGTVTLSAPTTGPTAGLAIYQDRNAPSTGTNNFSGGTNQNITGVLYFPSQKVTYSGGSTSSTAAKCTELIGYTLSFSGSSTFNSTCTGLGIAGAGGSTSKLVE